MNPCSISLLWLFLPSPALRRSYTISLWLFLTFFHIRLIPACPELRLMLRKLVAVLRLKICLLSISVCFRVLHCLVLVFPFGMVALVPILLLKLVLLNPPWMVLFILVLGMTALILILLFILKW